MDQWNRIPPEESQPTEPTTENVSLTPDSGSSSTEQSSAPQNSQPSPQPPPTYNPYGWTPYPPPPQKPPRKNHAGLVIGIIGGVCAAVIVLLSVLLVLTGDFLPLIDSVSDPDTTTSTTQPTVDRNNAPSLEITTPESELQGLTTRDIVKNNIDSTVLLTIYETYNDPYAGFGQGIGSSTEVAAGSATGIVMSADGYIITNWHCVVDESTNQPFPRVDVTLYNGTVYERAQLIGADSSTDLAVIKVDATDLKPAVFGNSDTVELGDKVVALGNSGGLGFSVTQGILSGLARDVYEDTGYAIKCFQVDAAINPGNSGGPLFDAAGQVIAVNSAKIVAEGYEGLGFSIPINEAKAIIDDLIQNGYVTGRVSLGITGQTYTSAYYAGFLIYTIEDNSPLKNTVARAGDLITEVNGKAVENYSQLRAALAQHNVGDTVTLTLLRSSNRKVTSHTVEVTLVEAKQ